MKNKNKLPEAGQYGSKHELSAVAKVKPEAGQYGSKHELSAVAKVKPEAGQYGSKHELSAVAKVKPEAGQQLCRCDEVPEAHLYPCHAELVSASFNKDCGRSNKANKGILKGWIATLTTFARNDKKRTAFTLAEVPEARQYRSKQAAFTLAEVLITLGIIGIVAAMTIPTLTKAYQKKIIETQIKKAYSEIRQGFALAEAENDIMSTWPTGANMDVANYTDTYIKPYFKGVKICSNMSQCGYKESNWNSDDFKRQWSGANWGLWTDASRVLFRLNDGVVVFMPRNSGSQYVDFFYVDVNGSAKPNTLNKDVFIINKGTAGGITPKGTLKTIMKNGWKLPANFDW